MKGKILGNIVTLPCCRSDLSGQSLCSSSARSKTRVHNSNTRKSIPQKKNKTYRKLNNSKPTLHVEPMDEVDLESSKSEFFVTKQVRPPRTSVVWLQRLYELWEPQLCDSYRPGVQSPLPPGDDNEEEFVVSRKESKRELKKKNSKKNSMDVRIGKLKAIETVVETVRHLQKVKTSPKPNLGRHSSVGIIESSAGGSRRNSTSLKRSLSQNANIP